MRILLLCALVAAASASFDGCGNADVVFVLDSSGSVGSFNWATVKLFVIDVTRGLTIGPQASRVAVVVYSDFATKKWDLTQFNSIGELETNIAAMAYTGGGTDTAAGMLAAQQILDDTGRTDMKHVVIVVTDGRSGSSVTSQAQAMHQQGIVMFAVGVGFVNQLEIDIIASEPKDTHAHYVPDFNALSAITDVIIDETCQADQCNSATSLNQSPIDINTASAAITTYPSFTFTGYDHVDVELTNDGRTVKAELKSYENALLTGGGLSGTYKLAQFHLSWGSNNSQGSEHTLDGTQYPMEAQFVHYNTLYANLSDAAGKVDGLAVMAYLFEVDDDDVNDDDDDDCDDDDDDDWDAIFNQLPLAEGSTVAINDLDLDDLMEDDDEFYRYQGSQTTPPCYENVTWTVFEERIEIKQCQLNKLRSLVDANNNTLADNFRPTQPLNGRTVYYSDD